MPKLGHVGVEEALALARVERSLAARLRDGGSASPVYLMPGLSIATPSQAGRVQGLKAWQGRAPNTNARAKRIARVEKLDQWSISWSIC